MIDEGDTLDSASSFSKPPPREPAESRGPARPPASIDPDAATMPVRESDSGVLGGNGAATYRLIKILGEGGFGSVWQARQTAPLQRDVAIKVLKRGMDTDAIVARFSAERQALAVLDHPSLAKVYDAGTTPEGLPFFAMEFVAGEPLDSYADKHKLSVRQRVELLIQVAEAVQHAHSKGLIHRDLKPPNILVTAEGTGHRAKVIDFGIAKVVNSALSGDSATMVGQILGSPDYMAPEQAAPGAVDIDTRADVWALGVVLYELITGSTPFQKGLLRSSGLEEWQRQLREVVPAKPSTRIRTASSAAAGQSSHDLAQRRGAASRELISTVHGDLDWIIMRCLEKERERRYASAVALAEDLRRYLRGDAVEAGPPTVRYRLGKVLRKYRVAVGFAAAAVLMLIASSVVSTALWQKSERQRSKAQATLDAIIEALDQANPEEGGSTAIALAGFLGNVEEEAQQLAVTEPVTAASFLHAIGSLRVTALEFEGAERALALAVELRRASVNDPAVGTSLLASSHHQHARSLYFLRRLNEAAAEYEEAIALWDPDHDAAARAESLLHLASVYARLEDRERSKATFDAAIAHMEAVHGPMGAKVADAYFARGRQARDQGRLQDAESDYTKTLEILTATTTEPDYRLGQALRHLGEIQAMQGLTATATGNYARGLTNLVGQLGDDHSTVCSTRDDFAELLLKAERLEYALTVARDSLASRRRMADKPKNVLKTLIICGRAAARAGETKLARQFLEEALSMRRALEPNGGLQTGEIAILLAEAHAAAGTSSTEISPLIAEALEEAVRAGAAGVPLAEQAERLRNSRASDPTPSVGNTL
ncbi:MAG: serine/threonine-protein kinase [Planctomycetota bacterium]|nr:serine/threonine-protein kinase [Planctomycetota bacterium]MDA1106252.1 serine/threonine-protein kinase [Planctomycetota bacterium]